MLQPNHIERRAALQEEGISEQEVMPIETDREGLGGGWPGSLDED